MKIREAPLLNAVKALSQLGGVCNLTVRHVKGHSDSLGNNAVDEVAKMIAKKAEVDGEEMAATHKSVKTHTKRVVREQRKLDIRASGCEQCAELWANSDGLRCKALLTKGMPRRDATQLARIQAGVSSVLSRDEFKLSRCFFCQRGQRSEAPKDCARHMVLECPRNESARKKAGVGANTTIDQFFKCRETSAVFIQTAARVTSADPHAAQGHRRSLAPLDRTPATLQSGRQG